jgi:hypothetical protein
MKPLNTIPIEDYINRVRIANKSNQKQVILDIKEASALSDSLAVVMTRLSGELDQAIINSQGSSGPNQVKMDGGFF